MKKEYIKPHADSFQLYMETAIAEVSLATLVITAPIINEDTETDFTAY